MAKTADLKAAKEAKQKKIAIGGAVLLVLILALSVPRTMKMLTHKAPTPAADSQNATQPAPVVTPSTPVPTPVAASGTPVSQVLSAPLEPAAHSGQLAHLSPTFRSKDPFVQQLRTDGSTAGASDSSDASTAAPKQAKKKAGESKPPASPATPSKHSSQPAAVPATPAATPAPNSTSPATAPTTPATKPAAAPYVSATISVGGVPEGVNVEADFPAASPLFHLLKVTKKTAVITIAGGSLANGAPTLTLRVGKAVTLVNTADGTRYRLVLVATSTAPAAPPTQTPGGASGPGATAPATTTPTQTTGG